MVFRLNDDSVGFPDPRLSEADGFLAFGGDMTPEWLLNAYYMGIFPWYDDKDGVPFWYSPDPRMLLRPSEFRCSKTLRRLLRSGRMVVRVDTAFRQVIEGCSHVKRDEACGESWTLCPPSTAVTSLTRIALSPPTPCHHLQGL